MAVYRDPPKACRCGLQVLPVVGTSYRSDALHDPAFAAGQPLSLVTEPDNPHDRNAVGIWDANRSKQVGFLPREFAPVLVGPGLPPIKPSRTLTLNLWIEGTRLSIKGKADR